MKAAAATWIQRSETSRYGDQGLRLQMEGACSLLRDLIAALAAPSPAPDQQEIARLKAQLRGWRDAGSGQPADEHGCPYSNPYDTAELNFNWALGRSAYLDSDVFTEMVRRADKASDFGKRAAQLDASLVTAQQEIERLTDDGIMSRRQHDTEITALAFELETLKAERDALLQESRRLQQ